MALAYVEKKTQQKPFFAYVEYFFPFFAEMRKFVCFVSLKVNFILCKMSFLFKTKEQKNRFLWFYYIYKCAFVPLR